MPEFRPGLALGKYDAFLLTLRGARDVETEVVRDAECAGLYLLLGAQPHCDWLPPEICLDADGFVQTGRDVPTEHWVDGLPPESLTTCVPGISAPATSAPAR